MKRLAFYGLSLILFFFLLAPHPALAVTTSSEITQYTNDTLNIIILISSAAAVFFLIKGGYFYLSSTGNPEAITKAKKTIKNALLGLVIVLAASLIFSIFKGALNPTSSGTGSTIPIPLLESVEPTGGLTQVLIDAVSGFMQNIVESATKPIVDGIIGYLTTTPSVLHNQTIVNFWMVILGITDSLFVVIVALLGLHFMSASTLGYDEVELSQLLPKIGLAFLGANTSLFLADYAIVTANALVKTVLSSTGGLAHAWVVDAINPATFITGTTPLITLVFLILFFIVAIVLLFMYISRFLLMIVPKFSDFAEVAVKSYVVTVFMVFVHVVIIQLASSFLSLPSQSGNSLVSIAVAIGLFLTLLKTPSFMMQMVFYNSANRAFRKIGHQIVNVMSTDKSSTASRETAKQAAVKTPRKVVAA